MRTGIANLPLHGGKAPRWLFDRMKKLAREIVIVMARDLGPEEILKKLSDPFWFQAFGCVLGFDWHSSGVTTTVCGAVKEGIRGIEGDLGIFAAGGKGGTSRKTPSEIERSGPLLSVDPGTLVYASRMSAKVDSAGLQDGYQLYHHAFFYTKKGRWAVVQQGMNTESRYARRYHWLGDTVQDFVCEPHAAVCCDTKGAVLNMVALESAGARETSAVISREHPDRIIRELGHLKTLSMPSRHETSVNDINPDRLYKIFLSTYENQPGDFAALLAMPGVGPKSIRALSLVSELVYGEPSSVRDPVRYSFAHGGKDGYPYPVDRKTYDGSIEFLRTAVNKARIDLTDRVHALKRLAALT